MQTAAVLIWCLQQVRRTKMRVSLGWVEQVVIVLRELAVSGYWKTADGNQHSCIRGAHKCVLFHKIVIPGGAIKQDFVAIERE